MHQGKISVRIKSGITFTFKLRNRPIQLVVFVPVGLTSFLHLRQVLIGAEVSSVVLPGLLSAGVEITLLSPSLGIDSCRSSSFSLRVPYNPGIVPLESVISYVEVLTVSLLPPLFSNDI
jgi:hypothetical protein